MALARELSTFMSEQVYVPEYQNTLQFCAARHR